MEIQQNISLKPYNTFQVEAKAKFFAEVKNDQELTTLLQDPKYKDEKIYILGGGSNVLILNDLDGMVIKISSSGIEKVFEDENEVHFKVQAGHSWHEFVKYCVDNNLQGVENLAFIPGSVGAAAVQNIAAYGQVQEDSFVELDAVNIETREHEKFDFSKMEFKYRTSILKSALAGKFVVTVVTYKLKKTSEFIPDISYHSRYESLADEIKLIAKEPYTLKDVFNAVISIRTKKLPSVNEVGTVGSFFVNPFVTKEKLADLQKTFPNIQFYPTSKMDYPRLDDAKLNAEDVVKIPAGWILEELGWRGKFIGNVGCSQKHALCVVTNWKASGKEVLDFISLLKKDVFEKTGIELESEVVMMS